MWLNQMIQSTPAEKLHLLSSLLSRISKSEENQVLSLLKIEVRNQSTSKSREVGLSEYIRIWEDQTHKSCQVQENLKITWLVFYSQLSVQSDRGESSSMSSQNDWNKNSAEKIIYRF